MLGSLILDRDDAAKLAQVGHAASTDKARPAITGTYLEWQDHDGKVTVKAVATDSYCAVVRTCPAERTAQLPPTDSIVVDAKALIKAMGTINRHAAKVELGFDGDSLIVGQMILPRLDDSHDGVPIQAKIESVCDADERWQTKRYGELPAFSVGFFSKVTQAMAEPEIPVRLHGLASMKGDAWLKPIMLTAGTKTVRGWLMPVRV